MSTPAEIAASGEAPRASFESDQAYFDALRHAGLVEELNPVVLASLNKNATNLPDAADARRIELLAAYYASTGNAEAGARRVGADRFLIHHSSDLVDAHGIVERLDALVPEVSSVRLERIGGGDEGPLILRCGEQLSAVTDDYDEELSADDIDLRSLEMVETISVRGLVGALNGLLAHTDFERRFVMLLADGDREVYVAVPSVGALSLLHEHLLDHDSEEWLIEYCAF